MIRTVRVLEITRDGLEIYSTIISNQISYSNSNFVDLPANGNGFLDRSMELSSSSCQTFNVEGSGAPVRASSLVETIKLVMLNVFAAIFSKSYKCTQQEHRIRLCQIAMMSGGWVQSSA